MIVKNGGWDTNIMLLKFINNLVTVALYQKVNEKTPKWWQSLKKN
jgi:hypothetical protein